MISPKREIHGLENENPKGTEDSGDECIHESGDDIGEIENKEVTEYQSKSELGTDGIEHEEENHVIDVVEINNRLKAAMQYSRKVNAVDKGPEETNKTMQEYSRRVNGMGNETSGDDIGEIENKEVTEYQSKSELGTDRVEHGEKNNIMDGINNRLKAAMQYSRKVNAMGKGPEETNKTMQEYSRRVNGMGNRPGSKTKKCVSKTKNFSNEDS